MNYRNIINQYKNQVKLPNGITYRYAFIGLGHKKDTTFESFITQDEEYEAKLDKLGKKDLIYKIWNNATQSDEDTNPSICIHFFQTPKDKREFLKLEQLKSI